MRQLLKEISHCKHVTYYVFVIYSLPFFKWMVPTVDTVRYQYLTQHLVKALSPVMMVGPVGTGKTSVVENTLAKLDAKTYSVLTVNMSAQVRFNRNFRPRHRLRIMG